MGGHPTVRIWARIPNTGRVDEPREDRCFPEVGENFKSASDSPTTMLVAGEAHTVPAGYAARVILI